MPTTSFRVSPRAAHGRHLRHHRGAASSASPPAIPTGATSARASPRPAPLPGAPPRVARRRHRRRRSGVRAGRRASGSCARRSPASTTASTGAACRRSTRAENVCVSGGGRAALTRAAASLGHINLGPLPARLHRLRRAARHLQGVHARSRSCSRASAATRSPSTICAARCTGRGLSALLLSNPCNPTGKLVRGDELARWVALARELDCTLLLDEFYSHYIWTAAARGSCPVESAARYVEDVNRDPVVLFDGLTKNWRYPGWRVTWTVGPQAGHRRGRQRRLVPRRRRLEAAAARGDPAARRRATSSPRRTPSTRAFRDKRDRLLAGLERLGVRIDRAPDGTFYVWGKVGGLPPPLERRHGLLPRRARPRRSSSCRASSST